jgi:hypothetical protein
MPVWAGPAAFGGAGCQAAEQSARRLEHPKRKVPKGNSTFTLAGPRSCDDNAQSDNHSCRWIAVEDQVTIAEGATIKAPATKDDTLVLIRHFAWHNAWLSRRFQALSGRRARRKSRAGPLERCPRYLDVETRSLIRGPARQKRHGLITEAGTPRPGFFYDQSVNREVFVNMLRSWLRPRKDVDEGLLIMCKMRNPRQSIKTSDY